MAEAAIVAHGLVKRFGPVVALDGIDLAVQVGSVLGLLGPNGAGKTTAVRPLLLGGPTASHAIAAIIWCAGIVAVFAPLSVLRYRRAA